MLWTIYLWGFSVVLGICTGAAIVCGTVNSLETIGWSLVISVLWPLTTPSIIFKVWKDVNPLGKRETYGQSISSERHPHIYSAYRRKLH